MHIPNLAIEKAVAGGWKMPSYLSRVDGWREHKHGGYILIWKELTKEEAVVDNKKFATQKVMPRIKQSLSYAEIALDPLFWQALGKSCGWDDIGKDYYFYAMQFSYLILTEQPTEGFWEEIL